MTENTWHLRLKVRLNTTTRKLFGYFNVFVLDYLRL